MTIDSILENKQLSSFIYSDAKVKVLIGGRRVGKSCSLIIDAIRAARFEDDTNIAFIVNSEVFTRYIKEHFVEILQELNYDYSIAKQNNGYSIKIGDNHIDIFSYSKLKRAMFFPRKCRKVFIDEPQSINNFQEVLAIVRNNLLWADNASIAMAGTGIAYNPNELTDFLGTTEWIAYTCRMQDVETGPFKNLMDDETFEREIGCGYLKSFLELQWD